MTKFCKDCVYVRKPMKDPMCGHPITLSPVTGEPKESCFLMRNKSYSKGMCPEGDLFKPKPPKKNGFPSLWPVRIGASIWSGMTAGLFVTERYPYGIEYLVAAIWLAWAFYFALFMELKE